MENDCENDNETFRGRSRIIWRTTMKKEENDMVEVIEEKDRKKFQKALENALKKKPNAQVHYSVSQGTGLVGSAHVIYTALLIS
jgi:hypothetical protein